MPKKKLKAGSVKLNVKRRKVNKATNKRVGNTKAKAVKKPLTRSLLRITKSAKRKVIKKVLNKSAKKAVPKVIINLPPKPRMSLAKRKKLQHYKEILLVKRRNVMEGIEKLRESAKGTESENISKYYDHPAEYGTDTMDREQYFLFISREEKYLLEIERSLEAIESGEYGTCRVCGKEIDEARLEAVPTTRICITCKMADQKARVSKTDFS
jgi:RNA polymerase-binding protein DksA